MEDKTTIQNRLLKNQKKLKKWLAKEQVEAYRLYDKDIPQYPYIIDIYKDSAIVYEKGKRLDDTEENQRKIQQHRSDIMAALSEGLSIPLSNIHLKKRERKKGKSQYEALEANATDQKTKGDGVVREHGCSFKVNLSNYLDSGLFLDHRPLRGMVKEVARGKSFLNLFCYTGAFSVIAASAGAKVTSVDMSKTYLSWARDNFRLNKLSVSENKFVHSDTFDFLKSSQEQFDLILCDPPSFSNSKRMEGSFDVQRDHAGLIRLCMSRLNENGTLYFSNNFRKFKLDEDIINSFEVKDITLKSIPKDFSDLKIHHCFEIRHKS